jgi:hypothetical protein
MHGAIYSVQSPLTTTVGSATVRPFITAATGVMRRASTGKGVVERERRLCHPGRYAV